MILPTFKCGFYLTGSIFRVHSGIGFVGTQRRWMRQVGSRWGNRLCKKHRRIWEAELPTVPLTESFTIQRMKSERLDKIKRITPIWQSRRLPMIGYKVGSMNLWDEWGERHFITVIKVDRLEIMQKCFIHKHGIEGVQFGLGRRQIVRQPRSLIGEAMKLQMELKHRIERRRCSSDCILPVKHVMSVRHFTPGQWVMVGGWTRARGFQGNVSLCGLLIVSISCRCRQTMENARNGCN